MRSERHGNVVNFEWTRSDVDFGSNEDLGADGAQIFVSYSGGWNPSPPLA